MDWFFALGASSGGGLFSFGWLGDIMSAALRFIHGFTHNWGLAIILFTVLIRLLLHPLNKKQFDSMKSMQSLQPEIEKLKKQYKDDQQTFNTKTMELYKERGVNPTAGCLPILLQMPILIALYNSILGLQELKTAAFLWLPSLGKTGDMTLVIATALVTFLQTYIQQKLTPNTSGNNPNTFLLFMMPLFIFMVGRGLPAGILVYWFTSTLIGTIQQYIIYKEPVSKGEAK